MAKSQKKTGYKGPPKSGQFKKGQSGNPSGRPKGSKNFKTEVNEELSGNITISENGKTKRVSKRLALVKSELAKGLHGDNKSFNSIMKLMERMLEEAEDDNNEEEPLSKTDVQILEAYNAKLLAKHGISLEKQPPGQIRARNRERPVRSAPETIAELKSKRKSNK